MPPSGFFSRNLLIGEASPSGSSNSILVLGRLMNTVETPWSGCCTVAELSAPSVSRYTLAALAMSRTAMATWLRRPLIEALCILPAHDLFAPLRRSGSYRQHVHMAHRFFAPALGDRRAHGAADSLGHRVRVT